MEDHGGLACGSSGFDSFVPCVKRFCFCLTLHFISLIGDSRDNYFGLVLFLNISGLRTSPLAPGRFRPSHPGLSLVQTLAAGAASLLPSLPSPLGLCPPLRRGLSPDRTIRGLRVGRPGFLGALFSASDPLGPVLQRRGSPSLRHVRQSPS